MGTKPPAAFDIVYVIGQLNVGGTERHLSMLARALNVQGWRIAVYSLAGDGPLRKELETSGVTVLGPPARNAMKGSIIFRALRLLVASVHLAYTLVRFRPRIVHFFLPAAYLIGAMAAAIARIDIRIMSRRSLNDYQRAYPAMRWLETRLHGDVDAILGNSRAVIKQLRDDERVPAERLCLIYNGIDTRKSALSDRQAMREMLKIDDNALVFIIVANLIPYKGHLDLVAALGIAAKDIDSKWSLLIVGRDDGVGPEIRAASQHHGIEDYVLMLGARSDVPDLLLASDVGLLCSHEEGFSNAILEGMAAGLPMIVTDVGGNAEAVLDERTGLVVPPRDPEALAAAIVRLARDPALRARYGASGRARIEEHFTLDACVAKYVALYRGLMAGHLPCAVTELQEQTV
jgi:glycosyltransferase involved in cell wall biosynthesis